MQRISLVIPLLSQKRELAILRHLVRAPLLSRTLAYQKCAQEVRRPPRIAR